MDYLGDFRRENRRSYFSLYGYASGIDVLRFYGFGNETEAAVSQGFYRVARHAVRRAPSGSPATSRDWGSATAWRSPTPGPW